MKVIRCILTSTVTGKVTSDVNVGEMAKVYYVLSTASDSPKFNSFVKPPSIGKHRSRKGACSSDLPGVTQLVTVGAVPCRLQHR